MKSPRRWPWILLAVAVLLGIGRIRFDVEILNLLPSDLPAAQSLKYYQEHFSDARELIVTLDAPTPLEAESSAGALAALLRDHDDLVADVTWQPAWRERPGEMVEFAAYLWLNQPPGVLDQLADRLAPTNLPAILADTREQLALSLSPADIATLSYDPYGLLKLPDSVSASAPRPGQGEELFASADGTFRLVFVQARPDLTSYKACRTWLRAVHQVIDSARAAGTLPPTTRLRFTGRPVFVSEIAGGMEGDMAGSAGGTLATIGVLFWLTHRRLRPLIWLLLTLLLILAATTALGGLFLGSVNVVSMGFAAILLGLAEDFGIVVYQESRSHPEFDARALRHAVAPGIFWSTLTTAGAFLTLNLSVLPGLGQLGTLVATGVTVASFLMLYGYLPGVLRWRRPDDAAEAPAGSGERFLLFEARRLWPRNAIWTLTLLLLAAAAATLALHGPRLDPSPNVLKPKHSEANVALEEIKTRFGRQREPLWVLVPGRNEVEVRDRLLAVEKALDSAKASGTIEDFSLPTPLWPDPALQHANRATAQRLIDRRESLMAAAREAGFTETALQTTDTMLDTWERAQTLEVFWPTNPASQWILRKVSARSPQTLVALALVHPTGDRRSTQMFVNTWPAGLAQAGVHPGGWDLLGTAAFDLVVSELPRVIVPIALIVIGSLWLAFRTWRELMLSLAALALSGLLLASAMIWLKWDWNLLNLMALPLLLGMGVDFSIHIQLALRRYRGDLLKVRRSVGRALLLAGSTTIAGFASLSFSTNTGMASLGRVCALGIFLALIVAVGLLPTWWTGWVLPRTRRS